MNKLLKSGRFGKNKNFKKIKKVLDKLKMMW